MSVPLGKLVFFSSVATSGTCTLLYFLIQSEYTQAWGPASFRFSAPHPPIRGDASDAFSRLEKEGKGCF